MRSVRDYLNLDETERWLLDAIDTLPAEVLPLIERMLDGNSAEFEEAEREFRAVAQRYRENSK